MDESVLEIRKIKYNAYIDKYPNKPYGYYALGELELMSHSHNIAMTYFTKALSLDEEYMRAKIGYILCLLHDEKYIQAIKFFSKKCPHILEKNIILGDLIHGITSQNAVTNPQKYQVTDCRFVNLKQKYRRISRMFKKNENVVAGMLLALHFYNNKSNQFEKTESDIVEKIVYLPGINETLRWHIIKNLSSSDESILDQDSLAAQFFHIPTNGNYLKRDSIILCEEIHIGKRIGSRIPILLLSY